MSPLARGTSFYTDSFNKFEVHLQKSPSLSVFATFLLLSALKNLFNHFYLCYLCNEDKSTSKTLVKWQSITFHPEQSSSQKKFVALEFISHQSLGRTISVILCVFLYRVNCRGLAEALLSSTFHYINELRCSTKNGLMNLPVVTLLLCLDEYVSYVSRRIHMKI